MGKITAMNSRDLSKIAENVARALSFADASGSSAFVTTAVTYANGSSVVVRIDNVGDDYFVTDGGHGYLSAETMGAHLSFNKVAPAVAARFGVQFDQHSFFVLKVSEHQLPASVATIANVSAIAVERTIVALEAHKVKQSHLVFKSKVREAFGNQAVLDIAFKGATREWRFDAAVESSNGINAVLELVSPFYNSVASAHMKLGDIQGLSFAPKSVAVLQNYNKTDPTFRNILSSSADFVIPVNSNIEDYQRAA